jgi:hypothetical protein
MGNWNINQALRNLIPKIEGNTNFPTVYKLALKHIETQQITIEF